MIAAFLISWSVGVVTLGLPMLRGLDRVRGR